MKKYRPMVKKQAIPNKPNILKRDFSTTTINKKWVTDITYMHIIKDVCRYLASVMNLYSIKIIRLFYVKNY